MEYQVPYGTKQEDFHAVGCVSKGGPSQRGWSRRRHITA